MNDIRTDIQNTGALALRASRELGLLTEEARNNILEAMAGGVESSRAAIIAANREDLSEGRKASLSEALLDRLELTDARIDAMCSGVREVCELPDPVGRVLMEREIEGGLLLRKITVPIGVIAMIYESRPNVTADASALCFKAGNSVILRGGKEAFRSNVAIADAIWKGGGPAGLPEGAIQLIRTTDRAAVKALCELEGVIDLVIPRGGESLIRTVSQMARVPVIKHYKGVCHLYVDESADQKMAVDISENAKCQRPGVCNAIETLLVHEGIAAEVLPDICERLASKGVEIRGDEKTRAIVSGIKEACEEDWFEEYLDLVISIRVVSDVASAIKHINTYGSHHSDSIVAHPESAAGELFLSGVDSAAVYLNASTRFTDGSVFGLGAEIGISTDKLHARGPMGVDELTTYKFVIRGTGQTR